MASLEIRIPDKPPRMVKIRGPKAVIGRAPENEIPVDYAQISRRHCEIYQGDDGYWRARDLGSSNGSYIDNEQITEVVLAEGMAVRLGTKVVVVFHEEEEAEGLAARRTRKFPKPQPKSSAAKAAKDDDDIYDLADDEDRAEVLASAPSPAGPPPPKAGQAPCPSCGAGADKGAVICVHCGYNFKTGKKVAAADLPGPAAAAPEPQQALPVGSGAASDKAIGLDDEATAERKGNVREYYIPIGMIVVAVGLAAAAGQIGWIGSGGGEEEEEKVGLAGALLLTAISSVGNGLLLFVSMVIAGRIGDIDFGFPRSAVVKLVAVATLSSVAWLAIPIPFMNYFAQSLVIVIAMIALFYLDAFEIFLVWIISGILMNVGLMAMMAALGSMMA